MNSRNKRLLTIDGILNIILGILLLLFPFGIAEYLGVPKSNNYFYPTILGGVILGIGIALLFERYGYANNFRGLGLGGAIIINIAGSSVLLLWLIFANLQIPFRGYIILWFIGISVFAIGIAELIGKSWKY